MPPLRPGTPASFLLLEGGDDLERARVVGTWLEGVRLDEEVKR